VADRCPNCGWHLLPIDPRAAKVLELRRWCAEQDPPHWIGPGDVVTEEAAAAMAKRARNTLRSWRATDQRLKFVRVNGSVRYRLEDIADFLILGDEKC